MKVLILVAILLALLLFAAIYFGQDRLIYFPRHYTSTTPGLDRVEAVSYETAGRKHRAFLLNHANSPPERIWWFFCGNGSVALDWIGLVGRADPAWNQAYVLFDYPGYGFNPGNPNPRSIARAVDDAFPAVAEQLGLSSGELARRSGVVGHSLGAAAALDTADRYEMESVIAISPFTSMKDMADRQVGPVLGSFLRHRFENTGPVDRLLGRESMNIVLFHGKRDGIVPFEMGESLSARANPHRGRGLLFIPVDGAGHNDIVGAIADDLLDLLQNPRQ
jgi:pimeloyl-ACP methyl ester carboxylesterase